jgi:hypothetical protein
MHLPFAPMIVASLLLIWAPPDGPNEQTQCVLPSIYLPSYLLPDLSRMARLSRAGNARGRAGLLHQAAAAAGSNNG